MRLNGRCVSALMLCYIIITIVLLIRHPSIVDNMFLKPSTFFEADFSHNGMNEKCPEVRRPGSVDIRYRHDHWQVGSDDKDDNFEVVVYSAFYDDRLSEDSPLIQILGVLTVFYVGDKRVSDRVMYCHVWFEGIDAPYVARVQSTTTGREHNILGKRKYGQRQFSCPLSWPDGVRRTPTHVSIAIAERCANSSILLPVTTRRRPPAFTLSSPSSSVRWQHELVVCVEASFGSIPAEVVVEWIEAYRMFGVERFNLYDGNLTNSETIRVLKHYAERGLVDFRNLPASTDDYSEHGIRLGSPTSLNDCMMRNMYSTRFVVVVDFDEIIVPRMHSNYSAMLAHIDSVSTYRTTPIRFATSTFSHSTRQMRRSHRTFAHSDCADAANHAAICSAPSRLSIRVDVCRSSITTAGFCTHGRKKACDRSERALTSTSMSD